MHQYHRGWVSLGSEFALHPECLLKCFQIDEIQIISDEEVFATSLDGTASSNAQRHRQMPDVSNHID